MFRSFMNMISARRDKLKGPQRHDFIDDLESVFWVYTWIITVQNGPGLKGLVPDSEKSMQTTFWETSVEPFQHIWKRCYLRDAEDDSEFENITPYFSKPVYLTLFHEFRALLHSYCDRKTRRPKDANGRYVELDFFSEMDEIYSKVLGYFDTAIQTLSPPPKAPTRLQPNRQAKRPRDNGHALPFPSAKRARVEETRARPPTPAIRKPRIEILHFGRGAK